MENYSEQPNKYSPDVDEVLQEEYESKAPPIDVAVCGPVKVQELPVKRSTYQTASAVSTTVGYKILGRDPRRKCATIVGLDYNIRIGASQGEAQHSGAVWPNLVPLVINGQEEVWACSVGTVTDISIQTEFWSD